MRKILSVIVVAAGSAVVLAETFTLNASPAVFCGGLLLAVLGGTALLPES